ncbi:MAG: 3-deoxy-D-manno-octulosonic acid transferase, partial [Mangrovimonas sp.]|nr:3-deoxy-D-manno-octulosonic acid transferase [Mangrovimonas sp.]
VLKKHLSKSDKTLWFHCASLGEFEQGLPVFKELRKLYPSHKFVVTFFSPSGYEIRKNTPVADVVVYLPWDTRANAKKFLDYVHPELIVFVKYEVWPNILLEAKKRNIKAILISALFRKDQIYFKPYGGLMKRALFSFEHIFTQNKSSEELLNSLGYINTTVSGDTRFDRVFSQLELDNTLDFVSTFKQNTTCVVAGSTWPEDEAYFIHYINSKPTGNLKFIIAPHHISKTSIEKLKSSLKVNTALYSEKDSVDLKEMKVLIIDTIGLLSKIYSYASIAYVGGAAGTTGLHNTLEPAVFGVPIIIGSHYEKFPEASDMIALNGMISVKNQEEFDENLSFLVENRLETQKLGTKNFDYIKKNRGAVIQILAYLRK